MAEADRQAGAALISAIAITMIFATVGVAAVQLVVNSAFNESRLMEVSRHQFAAEEAIASAIFQLAQTREAVENYSNLTVTTAQGPYTATVFDPRGLVDLNTASPAVLELLGTAAGATAPDQLAREILERRGATSSGDAFTHEDEIFGLQGAEDRTLNCLRLLVTVSSFQRAPQPDFTPPPLAAALRASTSRGRIAMTTGRLIGLDIAAEASEQDVRFRVLVRTSGDPNNPLLVQSFDQVPAWQNCPGYRS